jgi:hypothetical protein
MWYQAQGIYVAYARSRDGIDWHKPLRTEFNFGHPQTGPTIGLDDGEKELSLNRQ